MLREVVHKSPVEVLVHVAEAMTLIREHKHVETFSCLDQSIDHAGSISRMHIVIDVSMHKKKMAFQLGCDLRICTYLIYERGISLCTYFLLDTMMGFAPPSVINAVVVISCA